MQNNKTLNSNIAHCLTHSKQKKKQQVWTVLNPDSLNGQIKVQLHWTNAVTICHW